MNKRIGWIGLGRMGLPMSRRLQRAGRPLTVYNRTVARTAELTAAGAGLAATPADLAREMDVVFSMVLDDAALLEVTLGERGLLSAAPPGLLYVDMSTVSVSASARVAAACETAGVAYLRAPVSGSTSLAEAGTLTILASGPRESFDRLSEELSLLGQRLYYLGDREQARVMKLALNMMISAQTIALAESLTLGEKAGLDWLQMLEICANSAAGSALVKYVSDQLKQRDFTPRAAVRVHIKDADLALATARELEVAVPFCSLARQLWQATAGQGWADHDFSAVLLMTERSSGLEPVEGPR